jgi:hypothetical protein
MNEAVFQFWNNAQTIYDSLINKTCEGRVFTEQEALTFMELGQMLESYYKLQRLIVCIDIDKMEPKDDSDGLADIST